MAEFQTVKIVRYAGGVANTIGQPSTACFDLYLDRQMKRTFKVYEWVEFIAQVTLFIITTHEPRVETICDVTMSIMDAVYIIKAFAILTTEH